MAIEQTLVLIKPDAVLMGCEDDIKKRYIETGLKVIFEYPIFFSIEDATLFYRDHIGKFYFPGLILAMSCGLCRALILEGEEAIQRVRELNGPTDASKAPPGTIRHDFRSAGGPFNTVHASDGLRSFVHERNVLIGAQARISK